jgi:DNA anti-recombination protein RmuC
MYQRDVFIENQDKDIVPSSLHFLFGPLVLLREPGKAPPFPRVGLCYFSIPQAIYMEIYLLLLAIAVVFNTILLVLLFISQGKARVLKKISELIFRMDAITGTLESNFQSNRIELSGLLKDNRSELTNTLDRVNARIDDRLSKVVEQAKTDEEALRAKLETSFQSFNKIFKESVGEMNNLQREKFGQLEDKQLKLVESTERKLEQMRETVDEKLQKTLNERLGQSFELVGKQLESVQKGLGEMQSLAQDVGGLKRVLSNVKMRGGFGEVQLSMLLENILAPEQYGQGRKQVRLFASGNYFQI